MPSDVERLIQKSSNPKLVEAAFEFAKEAYKDRQRLSGENYIEHAFRVALMLSKMNLDDSTIVLGLLHDALDNLPDSVRIIEVKEIEKRFGKEVSRLVENISQLDKIRYSLSAGIKENKTLTLEKIENLRRMLLAVSGDLRVVLVNLASRLDGLNLLHLLPEDIRKLQSLETLQIFAPIASRLGLSEIRRSLEDVAFFNLYPDKYKWLKENVEGRYKEGERHLKRLIIQLKNIFNEENVKILDINYRAKSYWSTYKKLLSHHMDFDSIHDLLALRIITSDVESCYRILGIVHKNFKPISEEIDDYIAKPKINGYRSLHTTICWQESPIQENITEVQIRTEDMQKEAEYGVCAHWAYKEKINLTNNLNFSWTKGGPKGYPDFWKGFKIDFFPNKIFCFTPKGDVIVLPKNSTPVDFAYAVHSAIGNHCESAKINGKIAHLNQVLQNGDIIEVGVNKNKNPSADWLRFVKTSLAKSHIKKITEETKPGFKFPIPGFIRRRFAEISEASKKKKEERLAKLVGVRHIYIAGQKGMLTHIAKCCNPQPGDKVRAYLAPGRAAVLHKTTCNILKEIYRKFPEKTIDASWE